MSLIFTFFCIFLVDHAYLESILLALTNVLSWVYVRGIPSQSTHVTFTLIPNRHQHQLQQHVCS